MKIGEVVTLEGITSHGKKIVQESNDGTWVIEQITPATETTFNADAPGPWMMLRLEGDTDRRWVSQVKDDNFKVHLVVDAETVDIEPEPPLTLVVDPANVDRSKR